MKFQIILILILLFTVLGFAASVDTLTATLDMRLPLQEGWFDPQTETVGLRGDLNPLFWGETLQAVDPDGDSLYVVHVLFEVTDDSLEVELKIKIDGEDNPEDGWQVGRNHIVTLYHNQKDSLFLAWQDQAPEPPSNIAGRVQVIKEFNSDPLKTRDIYIYFPPGYDHRERRFPVLYMHDGQNLFDAAAAGQEWKLDEAAEKLIKDGEIEPLIIVGIGNTRARLDEYTPTRQKWHRELSRKTPPNSSGPLKNLTGAFATSKSDSIFFQSDKYSLFAKIPGSDFWQPLACKSDSVYYLARAGITFHFNLYDNPVNIVSADKPPMGGKGNDYGYFITSTLKPFIDRELRTKPDFEHTFIGGSSLGGLITLHFGLSFPNVFSKMLVLSPSLWWDNREMLARIDEFERIADQSMWLYVGTGEGEQTIENVRVLKKKLEKKGWDASALEYVEAKDAAHNERAWSAQAEAMLKFLVPIQNDKE